MAVRIQRKRTKGWKMPPNTVSVTRPGQWGNPFQGNDPKFCVYLYRSWLAGQHGGTPPLQERRKTVFANINDLRGKNLACFCPLDQPCHADVLLELAAGPSMSLITLDDTSDEPITLSEQIADVLDGELVDDALLGLALVMSRLIASRSDTLDDAQKFARQMGDSIARDIAKVWDEYVEQRRRG